MHVWVGRGIAETVLDACVYWGFNLSPQACQAILVLWIVESFKDRVLLCSLGMELTVDKAGHELPENNLALFPECWD